MLREFRGLDQSVGRHSKMNLLSTDGKILAVLAANPNCIVKDLPSLAGVSQRAAFECVRKLCDMGVIEKHKSTLDRRAVHIRVKRDLMCQRICNNRQRII